MGSKIGILKIAAKQSGVELLEYLSLKEKGMKFCWKCREWKPQSSFGRDSSRYDGRDAICKSCRPTRARRSRILPRPSQRIGNQASEAVRQAVKKGTLPQLSRVSCARCGLQAHHYHHWRGYDKEYLLDVIPLCIPCHRKEHWNGQNY